MALREYRRKRDFHHTTEPTGGASRPGAPLRFVVQKHAASRLHYDFRLELDGVLKSWAVPKGPSLDPAVKALAVEVEDHPLDYADFEGVIPAGQYGGGTVMLWDEGGWEPLEDARRGYRAGKLVFRLTGKKLAGEWALVRMHGKDDDDRKNWLLIKHTDRYATLQKSKARGDEKAKSVRTGRTMDEIATAADAVWQSNGSQRNGRVKKPAGGKTHSRAAKPKSKVNDPERGGRPDPGRLSGARKAAQPNSLAPQLPTLVKAAPRGDNWLHELKFDGYRLVCIKNGDKVRLLTRNDNDWSARFPDLVAVIQRLRIPQVILDGEVVLNGPDGHADFQGLQNSLRSGRTGEVIYYVFDLPHASGFDLTACPLIERKQLLEQILSHEFGKSAGGRIQYSDHVVGHGPTMLEHACRLAIEGIVSKQADSPYTSGRSRSWLKEKCLARQEFVVAGFTPASGARAGFGALLLGVYDERGLVYCGRVGTGFTAQSLREIAATLKPLASKESAYDVGPTRAESRGVHWLRPALVAEVEFSTWTDDDRLRHPSFQGLREDKDPKMVRRERAQGLGETQQTRPVRSTNVARNGKKPAAPRENKKTAGESRVGGVRITHATRIVYPDRELTKLDVAEYYDAVADWILPGVVARPLTIVRCPQGLASKCFYQKHIRETLPPPVRGVEIEEARGKGLYVVIDDLPGLITLVQFGALELHPWGSRVDSLEQPDRLVFDFDPAPDVPWSATVQAARRMREMLADLKLQSFPRTTGGKGLHVVVPLTPNADWILAKSFAKAMAERFVRQWPERYIATASKAKRKGKIFVDYLRNSRGATSIASYSTRARPGATVATPLAWEELTARLMPQRFDIKTVAVRLRRLRSDPWKRFDAVRQSITQKLLAQAAKA